MNATELRKILKNSQVPSDAYSILERPKDESLVFAHENDRWVVYYFERGQRTQEVSFNDEHSAGTSFLERIMAWFK